MAPRVILKAAITSQPNAQMPEADAGSRSACVRRHASPVMAKKLSLMHAVRRQMNKRISLSCFMRISVFNAATGYRGGCNPLDHRTE
jgi:hypothetical protein